MVNARQAVDWVRGRLLARQAVDWVRGRLLTGYLLCVINSSHTFTLTFFKLCTVLMDTLKICMWLFGSAWTFFKKLHVLYFCSYKTSFETLILWAKLRGHLVGRGRKNVRFVKIFWLNFHSLHRVLSRQLTQFQHSVTDLQCLIDHDTSGCVTGV
jgi:hypothetical protein